MTRNYFGNSDKIQVRYLTQHGASTTISTVMKQYSFLENAMFIVPNKTETPRQYARRALYDLAHILEHLGTENWDSRDERKALLAGLETHAKVLYGLANHIEDGGNFNEDSADASDAFLATPPK